MHVRGGTWDTSGSTLVVYTSSGCSTGGPANINSVTWVAGDKLIIQSTATVVVYNNQSISVDVTIDVYGSLLFETPPNAGKLSLTTSSTIVLEPGSTISCTTDGGATTTTCSNSDQINIGSWKYKGTDINLVNTYPKPTTMNSSGSPLPITLSFFKGSVHSDKILLNWTTSAELNFDHFNLEKSTDGKDFYTLAQIKGHGTTNVRQDYEAVDNFPIIGYNYYRLTSVDFDNYRETFDAIAVRFEGEKKIALSPNPFNGTDLTFHANFDISSTGALSIFDNMGLLVHTDSISESNSVVHFSSPLKSGVYIARFNSQGFYGVTKLIVQ